LFFPKGQVIVQVINTKLSVPPLRAKLVERSGLIQKLNRDVERGFVLVSAPAGYGKSTLLGAWLTQVDFPCAWISLDAKDNDLGRFLTYLATALQMADPSTQQILEASLHLNAPIDAEASLTPLINHLAQSSRPLCLVLDDYHVIQKQAVHQVVGFLLEHRPASLYLVVSTRADPPLPLARLRARSAVLEIRQSDLCFSTQESAEFLNHTMELQVSSDDIRHLTERTEGWIAGLQMAGLSLQGKTEISKFIRSFSGENRYILSFLFDEVFKHQTKEMQNFLLQTSLLERLCGPLCDVVTQRNDSQLLLETLENSNLFLIALDEEKQWYRYHHLFAELLRSRLGQTASASIASLHQRACTWYATQKDIENAIAHALAVPDYGNAANLIEQGLQNMDLISRQPLLVSWIDSIPIEILMAHPWLCAYRAYGDYWTGHRERAEDWLLKAEQSSKTVFATNNIEFERLQGFIAAVRAHTALVIEDIPNALEMAKQALSLLPEGDMMRSTTGIALGVVYWAMGDAVKSEQAFQNAQLQASRIQTAFAVAPTCYLGLQQIKQGRLQVAMATFREALRLASSPGEPEAAIAGFPNIRLGDVLRQRNELGLALQHINRGLEQCLRLQQVDFLADAYVCKGRCQLATGDLEGSSESIQKVDYLAQHARIDQWVICWLDDLRLKCWLAAGELDAVRQWVKTCNLAPNSPLSYLYDLHHQNLARALVAQCTMGQDRDTYEQAAGLLSRLLEATQKAGWVHEEIIVRVMQAVNQQAIGQTEAALESLTQAVLLAQPGGYIRVFLDEGKVMHSMLAPLSISLKQNMRLNLSQQKIIALQEYVALLLSAFESPLDADEQSIAASAANSIPEVLPKKSTQHQGLVDPLSNRELEILQLLALGYSDKKIAQTLFIAPQTVHKHLRNIYEKLFVHSRTEAIAHARELSLL